jgi:hypothetical protein
MCGRARAGFETAVKLIRVFDVDKNGTIGIGLTCLSSGACAHLDATTL